MRILLSAIFGFLSAFLACQAAFAVEMALPGKPLDLSAAEKQNLERFLDHFNWEGVMQYTPGVPRLPSALWDIWVHQPKLVAKKPDGATLSIGEKLAADNVLKLYGFPLNEADLAPGYSLKDGSYLFSDSNGPRDGKTSIDKVFKLDNGKLLIEGKVLATNEGSQTTTPFLAVVGVNDYNKAEGYSLEKQISLE